MGINWKKIDHDAPPTGQVLLYFPRTDSCGEVVKYGAYGGLTARGKAVITHWCKFEAPEAE